MSAIVKFSLLSDPKKRALKASLTRTIWLGNRVEIPGFSAPASEVFGDTPSLTFMKNGSCTLVLGDRKIRARWKIKADQLLVKGRGLKTQANLSRLDPAAEITDFTLSKIDNYLVTFLSQTYLAELPKSSKK